MKGNRTLIVLAMIFVLLVALLAFQNIQRAANQATQVATASTTVFPDLRLNDIQAIRLRSPETGQTFVIARAADGSWMAPESSGTLNTTEAENIARTMVLLPYTRVLPVTASDDMATYGFTPEGILSIEIILSSGANHVVAVGYRTPTEESYYALADDRTDLYLIDRAPIDFLLSRLKSPPIA